jgi:hypothetical protein
VSSCVRCLGLIFRLFILRSVLRNKLDSINEFDDDSSDMDCDCDYDETVPIASSRLDGEDDDERDFADPMDSAFGDMEGDDDDVDVPDW